MFIKKLSGRHEAFLDALDKAGVTYAQAVKEMKSAAPSRSTGKPRVGKEAAAVAKMLCRKYANQDADEMLASFVDTVGRPEFRQMVVDLIHASLAKFGRNKQGKIRVRPERKGADGKALAERAKKARAAKKGKG